jgi:hypothetical protein
MEDNMLLLESRATIKNEESNDEEHNNVDNDHGEENGNKGGHSGDSNECGKGGASGFMVGGSSDVASVGNGDGRSNNVFHEQVHYQEEPI